MKKLDVQDQVIPDNVVLHGLKQRNGKFIVRIFGVNDNPKENRLFGRNLDELEDTLGVKFWEENGQTHTLWSAALYQESDTIREAADAALELYEIVTGKSLTELHGLQLPISLSAPDLMRRIRMLS